MLFHQTKKYQVPHLVIRPSSGDPALGNLEGNCTSNFKEACGASRERCHNVITVVFPSLLKTRMFSVFGEIKPKCKGGSILLLHGHSCPIDHLGNFLGWPKKKGFNEQKTPTVGVKQPSWPAFCHHDDGPLGSPNCRDGLSSFHTLLPRTFLVRGLWEAADLRG